MKKTTIYLEQDLDQAITRLAAEQGVTKAHAIREALRAAAYGQHRPRIGAIGVARGPGDVASEIERHLEETGFGRE